ncbi:MAG: adenylosuccinate lyase, partial [Acidimicrobiales bacterium]
LGAGLENVALWHERDISHSSVERVILPDSSLLAYYVLVKARSVVDGLVVNERRMLENLDRSLGLVFSQPVLLALVDGGMTRDGAYRVVQEDAARAWSEQRPFRAVLEADERITVDRARLDEAFSLSRALRHRGAIFDALEEIEES